VFVTNELSMVYNNLDSKTRPDGWVLLLYRTVTDQSFQGTMSPETLSLLYGWLPGYVQNGGAQLWFVRKAGRILWAGW